MGEHPKNMQGEVTYSVDITVKAFKDIETNSYGDLVKHADTWDVVSFKLGNIPTMEQLRNQVASILGAVG